MQFSYRRPAIAVGAAALLIALTVASVLALENAYNYRNIANRGISGSIVTGNPTLRDNAGGKWSYMRLGVHRIISGNVYYIEIGWLKGAQPESNGTPRGYWTYRNTNGTTGQGWVGYPGVGIGYNYRVKRTSTNTWGVYFNDLNNPVTTAWVGWDNADDGFSGGEVPNTSQGMGYSGNNNLSYLNSSGTSWFALCSTSTFITNALYHVDPVCTQRLSGRVSLQ